MLYIIIGATLIFLLFCLIIYWKEFCTFLKSKFKKKSKNGGKTEVKEKPKEKAPEVKYEDFVPLSYDTVKEMDNKRDSSLDELFGDLFEGFDGQENSNVYAEQRPIIKSSIPRRSSFEGLAKSNTKKDKTIAQKFKELPPEIKTMIIDGTLKQRDDYKEVGILFPKKETYDTIPSSTNKNKK